MSVSMTNQFKISKTGRNIVRPMISVVLISLGALCVLLGPVQAACTNATAIWASDWKGARYIIYGTAGVKYGSTVYIEKWLGKSLVWRGKGSSTCSNGASICYVRFENDSGRSGNNSATSTIVEVIDGDGDGVSDWVILAALSQNLYHGGGLRLEWFNGYRPIENKTMGLPNIYKFLGCRKTDVLKLSPESGRRFEEPVGDIYATADVCENYLKTGSLEPKRSGPTNKGIWWMDDQRIVGWQKTCYITNINSLIATADCNPNSDGTLKKFEIRSTFVIKQIGHARQVSGDLLIQCSAK